MKIFAKRKPKKASSEFSSDARGVNKSDPVVEELLKKDPSEWNAKQRRMIKRYHDRKSEEVVEKDNSAKVSVEPEENRNNDTQDTNTPLEKDDTVTNGEEADTGYSSKDDSSGSSSDSEEEGAENEQPENRGTVEQPSVETNERPTKESMEGDEDEEMIENDKVDKEHAIWKLLDKLNSKQKRTLSRKLDRLGKAVLEDVVNETKSILGASTDDNDAQSFSTPNKRSQDKDNTTIENVVQGTEPKKKKRKKEVDWSSLPPEERLRREEQRRLQQEAAERKGRGEDVAPGHKHPLNSQRRRANRRKPKWKKSSSGLKNEHNSSGYLVRKHGGEEQAV